MSTSQANTMTQSDQDHKARLEGLIAAVPDFPKPGILFRDITPALANPQGLRSLVALFASRYKDVALTQVVGIESRGFIMGALLAEALGLGLTLVRKPGKLPRKTISRSYALEYGEDTLHLHEDSLGTDDTVVVVDDLIATGGTARATCELVQDAGATVHEVAALIELDALQGRQRIAPFSVHAWLHY